MKMIWLTVIGLSLTGCMTAARGSLAAGALSLPDLGPAPEWENSVWLNTEAPLRLADLRGKVVLLDMWTFG